MFAKRALRVSRPRGFSGLEKHVNHAFNTIVTKHTLLTLMPFDETVFFRDVSTPAQGAEGDRAQPQQGRKHYSCENKAGPPPPPSEARLQ